MRKIPKGILIVVAVVVVTVAVYLRQVVQVLQAIRFEETPAVGVAVQRPKEVSAVVAYDVNEEVSHEARFTLGLDPEGVITSVSLVENPTGVASDKQKEFAGKLEVVIKGKKLSELNAVDRIGTSSYTTNAFNSVIDKLKSQI
ncbi:MAG: hypothetical protein WAT81_00985 [Candidatus Moraniibacteriota bacterium]